MSNLINSRLDLPTGSMNYIRFGDGAKNLVIIPGVEDGLKSLKASALSYPMFYRPLMQDFTVWVFSRRDNLPEGMTTREMAEDLNLAMNALDLTQAAVMGISLGGMIAQWLAIDHPEHVRKLVLVVTASRANETGRAVIGHWIEMAKQGDYQGIMLDTAERSYTPERFRKVERALRILGDFGKPESLDRFMIQATSCLNHYTYDQLHRIQCPTLVIGGTDDRIATAAGSINMAVRIPNCELRMVEGLGHGLYEEEKDFLEWVRKFCA